MPAKSKSQQRLFGMVHAYQKGKLKDAPESVKEIARSISDEDAEHFAKTKHKGLPEKKASALNTMVKLFGKSRVGSWRQMAAAGAGRFNPKLEAEINKVIRNSFGNMTPEGRSMASRMAANGSRDFINGEFRMTPRHLDAIDPSGRLKSMYMDSAFDFGGYSRYGDQSFGPTFRTSVNERYVRNGANPLHRDRAIPPTTYNGLRSADVVDAADEPFARNAGEYVGNRIQRMHQNSLAEVTNKKYLRELSPERADQLVAANRMYGGYDSRNIRDYSNVATDVFKKDLVENGLASPDLVSKGKILPTRADTYAPSRILDVLAKGSATPGGFAQRLYSSIVSKKLRGAVHVPTYIGLERPGGGIARRSLEGIAGTPMPGAAAVFYPGVTTVGGKVYYDPYVLMHEFGHVKGGNLAGFTVPRMTGSVAGRMFPGLQRRALLSGNPRAQAWMSGTLGPEYVANKAAFGPVSAWSPQTRAAYNTYVAGALFDNIARYGKLSPEQYRTFIRNYFPYGVN